MKSKKGLATFISRILAIAVIIAIIIVYNSIVMQRKDVESAEKAEYDAASESYESALAAANSEESSKSNYKDGTYKASARGYGGDIEMQVTIKNGEISDVKCLSHDKEDDAYFDTAKSVIDEINEEKTWDVDTASGATFSSNGIINAVKAALGKAEK